MINCFSEFKTEYIVGEELDITNGVLKVTQNGAESYVEITSDMIDYFNSDVVGTRKMVLSYKGKSIEIEYTVSEPLKMLDKQIYYDSSMAVTTLYYVDYEMGIIYAYSDNNQRETLAEVVEDFNELKVNNPTGKYMQTFTTEMNNGKLEIIVEVYYGGTDTTTKMVFSSTGNITAVMQVYQNEVLLGTTELTLYSE